MLLKIYVALFFSSTNKNSCPVKGITSIENKNSYK